MVERYLLRKNLMKSMIEYMDIKGKRQQAQANNSEITDVEKKELASFGKAENDQSPVNSKLDNKLSLID